MLHLFKYKKLNRLTLSGLAVFCAGGIFLSRGIGVRAEELTNEERLELQRDMPVDSNLIPNWPAGPVVSAEAAILMDADTGTILYSKNIHQKEYPASTTKILTTLIATEMCSMDEVVTFPMTPYLTILPEAAASPWTWGRP